MGIGVITDIFKTLNSDSTPNQIAFGASLGMIMLMTPFLALHNFFVICLLLLFNVSIRSAIIVLVLFLPLGLLSYFFTNKIGIYLLLTRDDLEPFWLQVQNTPFLPFFRLNDTLVLGSLVFSLLAFMPTFFAVRIFVIRYRKRFMAWWVETKVYKVLKQSKLAEWVLRIYNWLPF